jgi:hypothetical protein
MISFPEPKNTTIKNILDQNSTLNLGSGCTIEYNMNQMVDGITVTNNGTEVLPFKTLFPVSSVIKPFRPFGAGIKYAIDGDVTSGTYRSPKTTTYPIDYRSYYPGSNNFYKYWISAKGGSADITVSYPKTILTNKIVVKFELAHSTTSLWTIYRNGSQIAQGSSITPFKTSGTKNHNAGVVTIYYNGSTWSTTEPSVPAAPVSLDTLRLTAAAVSGKYIGVIEIAPCWQVDLTSRLASFSINKESSSSAEDILPVGYVSANSLSMDIVSYETSRTIKDFLKTLTFSSSNIYMYKNAKISPYYKIYHSAGDLSDSRGTYDKIIQGDFYLDTWSTSEFGEISLTALDSAKFLQETVSPSVLCEGYSATAILRRLLDAVGFTSYNFNLAATETSVFSPRYWWSEDTKTVWQAIQEICRDSQMIATFDENNILQFYTRDYMFNTGRLTDWTFRSSPESTSLANIINFNRNNLPSVNKINVVWRTFVTSNYPGDSQPLWKSGNSFMSASSLEANLLSTDLPVVDSNGNYTTKVYVKLAAIVPYDNKSEQEIYDYSGYLVIDSEIIEYDAIEFSYIDLNGTPQLVDVMSDSDVLKYRGLALPGVTNYKKSGRYRVKTRGALNTKIDNHYAQAVNIINGWTGYEVVWQ